MSVSNGSFEDFGARIGLAAGWTLSAVASLTRVAGFGDPPVGYENFGWGYEADVESDFAFAIFDALGEALEDFYEGWLSSRTIYFLEILDGISEVASFDGETAEAFSWDGDPWYSSWSEIPVGLIEAADGSVDVVGYATLWSQIDAASASFSGDDREDFSAGFPDF